MQQKLYIVESKQVSLGFLKVFGPLKKIKSAKLKRAVLSKGFIH